MALRPAALTTSLLLAALLAACAGGPAGQPAARIAPETPPAPSAQVATLAPQANNLDATAWMQTSAEYRAAVAGSYALARQQLDAALADPAWDAMPPEERAAIRPATGLPPAIITDADETLIDNSPFQARRIASGAQGFDYDAWAAWVNEAAARPLPGALAFARYAASRGVVIYYVTNRDAPGELEATIANLRAAGFPVAEDASNVMLRGDARAPDREKGERRRWIGERHRVVLMLGDNLGDFVDGINTDRAGREALVDAHAARWGTQWIMLPNPAYGSWEAALMRDCASPEDATRCKRDGLRTE